MRARVVWGCTWHVSRVITANYLQRRGAEGTGTNETVRDTAASPVMCCVMCYVLCDLLYVLYVFILDVSCVMCQSPRQPGQLGRVTARTASFRAFWWIVERRDKETVKTETENHPAAALCLVKRTFDTKKWFFIVEVLFHKSKTSYFLIYRKK